MDFANRLTVGIGHLILPGEHFGNLTIEQAKDLLRRDLAKFETCINSSVTVPLTQPQFDCLCSFAFNEGCHAFATSTLVKMLNVFDYAAVPAQLARWTKYTEGGVVKSSPTLTQRRAREARLWETGDYG